MAVAAAASLKGIGIPVKLIHEAEGHVVLVRIFEAWLCLVIFLFFIFPEIIFGSIYFFIYFFFYCRWNSRMGICIAGNYTKPKIIGMCSC